MEVRTYTRTLKMLVEAENDVYYTIRYLVFSVNFRGLFHQVQKLSNKVYIPLVCSMVRASGRQGRAYDMNFSQLRTWNHATDYIMDSTINTHTFRSFALSCCAIYICSYSGDLPKLAEYLQLLNLVHQNEMAVIGWLSEVPLGYIVVGISVCVMTLLPHLPNGSLLAKLSSFVTW